MSNSTPPNDVVPQTRGRVLRRAAWVYDAVMHFGTLGWHDRLIRATADILAPRPGEHILDIGCGTGLLTLEIGQRLAGTGEVVGIDASPEMIQIARKKRSRSNCRFELATAESLPFADTTFDAACSSMFFHHVDADLKRRALRELARTLRPGGRVVIVDMGIPYSLLGKCLSYGAYAVLRQPEIHENIKGVLPAMMAECGFSPVREEFRRSGYILAYSGIRT